MSRRFRYALEPILMTRQWALNALLLELGEQNEALTQAQNKLANLQGTVNTAYQQWQALTSASQGLSVDGFVMHNRYIADCLAQVKARQDEITKLNQARDELIEKVVAAEKAVEAVEQHREEMHAKFLQLRASGDFKIADDQWNTILARLETEGEVHGA